MIAWRSMIDYRLGNGLELDAVIELRGLGARRTPEVRGAQARAGRSSRDVIR